MMEQASDCGGRASRALALAAVAVLLAGCSSTPGGGNTIQNILFLGTANPPPAPSSSQIEMTCPPVEIQPGTAAYQVYAGSNHEPGELRYQAQIGERARECANDGTQFSMRIGVAGRVIVGPKGAAGQSVDVPLRIAVVDQDDKPRFSRLERIRLTTTAEGADFQQIVETGMLPMPDVRLAGWRVLIGFDQPPAPRPAVARAPRPRLPPSGAQPARAARPAPAPTQPGGGPNLPPIYGGQPAPAATPAPAAPAGPALPPIQLD